MHIGNNPGKPTKPFAPRLVLPGVIVLLTFSSLWTWQNSGFSPLWLHLVLVVGLFPLIVGSMIFFAGPLTRSGPPEKWVTGLPFAALAVGVGAVWGVHGGRGVAGLVVVAAMGVSGALLYWLRRRGGLALGGANPGLAWYLVAMSMLLSGLAAMLIALVHPQWWLPLRQLHMHLNLLGFIGLTALGTLQVFLPTVGHYTDPEVGLRLRRDLKYALAGALLMAMAAAFELDWLTGPGLLAWFMALFPLLRSLWRHRREIWRASGAALSLVMALFGFIVVLILGTPLSLPLFFGGFLLPLLTAALSHLLPLWWWPTGSVERRTRAQAALGRGGSLRGGLFLLAGVLMHLHRIEGALLAMVVVLVFTVQLLLVVHRARLATG